MTAFVTRDERNEAIEKLHKTQMDVRECLMMSLEYEKTKYRMKEVENKIYLESYNRGNWNNGRVISDTNKKKYYFDKIEEIYQSMKRIILDNEINEDIGTMYHRMKTRKKNEIIFNKRLDKLRPHYDFAKRYSKILESSIKEKKDNLGKIIAHHEKVKQIKQIKVFETYYKYLWIFIQLCEKKYHKDKNNKRCIKILNIIQEILIAIYKRQQIF